MAVNSAVLCALAFSAQIRVWHIAVGGIAAGIAVQTPADLCSDAATSSSALVKTMPA
jgi:hypothetical protein